MTAREYFSGLQPFHCFFVEVLRPGHPCFARMPGLYAAEVLALPLMPGSLEQRLDHPASNISVGDVILISHFRNIYSSEQFQSEASEQAWRGIVTSEIRHTSRQIIEASNSNLETVGRPVADGDDIIEDTRLTSNLIDTAVRQALEGEVSLFGTVDPSYIFAKVLQGSAR